MSRSVRWFAALAWLWAALPAFGAADPAKVLHFYFPVAETGFDPARVSDVYSSTINEAIFERLLTYDYLARPAKLVPMVAEAMPKVEDDGRTWTFRIKPGIYFADDPAFDGNKRELVAEDFVYSFERFFDPKIRSPYAFMLDGIVGLDEAQKQAEKTGRQGGGAAGARPLHAAHQAQGDRLQFRVQDRAHDLRRGGA